MSRRLPHFNRQALQQTLADEGIRYVWLKSLGGRRNKICHNSPNIALRSMSFRNYADHMMTEPAWNYRTSGSGWGGSYRVHVRRTGLFPVPSHARVRLAG